MLVKGSACNTDQHFMAKVVLGIGTSHSPLLVLSGQEWECRSDDDRRNPSLNTLDGRRVSYDQLAAERNDAYLDRCKPELFSVLAVEAGYAIDRLSRALEQARPDVVIVIGDDQGELFGPENQPALCVYHGNEMTMKPFDQFVDLPSWADKNFWSGYRMDHSHTYPVASDLALDIVKGLITRGVDVTSAASIPISKSRGFGHAFGFIIDKLMTNIEVPIIPVLLNTYFPPNTPTAARCYEIGEKLRRALEASPINARVAVVASGGLSHFLCEEHWDREILDALKNKKVDILKQIPQEALQSGSSEVRNWIVVAGIVEDMQMDYAHYIPVYRTPAGTGIGLGFATWKKNALSSVDGSG